MVALRTCGRPEKIRDGDLDARSAGKLAVPDMGHVFSGQHYPSCWLSWWAGLLQFSHPRHETSLDGSAFCEQHGNNGFLQGGGPSQ